MIKSCLKSSATLWSLNGPGSNTGSEMLLCICSRAWAMCGTDGTATSPASLNHSYWCGTVMPCVVKSAMAVKLVVMTGVPTAWHSRTFIPNPSTLLACMHTCDFFLRLSAYS